MSPRPAPPVRLLAALLTVQTVVGLGAAVRLQPPSAPAADRTASPAPPADPLGDLVPVPATVPPAPPVEPPPSAATEPVTDASRAAAVTRLLDARAAAVLRRDRDAFLATVDAASPEFRTRQASLFDALATVPLRSWAYDVDERDAAPPTDALDARYRTAYWRPSVTLRYALDGVDDRPTAERQGLTFVARNGRWLLASDTDRPDRPTPRGLWDNGPVVAVRGTHSLVLGHPGQDALLRRTATEADRAVETVTAVHGRDWPRRVAVLVPDTVPELAAVLGEAKDLSAIAAVATARLDGPEDATVPVGDRVVLNPSTFPTLGASGRRVVLTHEVVHVATRRVTGPAAPVWLVEGYADHVGYTGAGVAVTSAARELTEDVRAGRLPAALPRDADFAGTNPALPQAYEGSWLACELIADEYGRAALRRFYLAVGAGTGRSDAVVRTAMRDVLGTTPEDFTRRWQEDLRRRLGGDS